jgi:predicted signal transduction protein with EAL and GGDEF domain
VALYLTVAIGMPLATALAYAIALVSYRAFVDLIRSSVDLYRFALIDALHLHRPPSLSAERKLWSDVDQNMSYGGNLDLPYESRP